MWGCDMAEKKRQDASFEFHLQVTLGLQPAQIERLLKTQDGEYYPPNYDYEGCKGWWKKAESVMKAKLDETGGIGRDQWKEASQIEIGKREKDSKGNSIYSKFMFI